MNNPTEDKQTECFVAMWFGSDRDSVDEMNQLYEMVIQPAVESFNFKPYQVDKDDRADRLFDDILNAIDRADFVIVDLTHSPKTGLRGSVLFEAGYAFRSKPVIWMCREDLADKCTPFDAAQLRQIRWNNNRLTEAKNKLKDIIRGRIKEQGKQRTNHEIKRLCSEIWKQIETAEDLHLPEHIGGSDSNIFSADQIRLLRFEEFCDDLKTRIDYKDMGLTQDEKYELADMIRGWNKFILKITEQERVPGIDFYKKLVLPKLRATGWIDI